MGSHTELVKQRRGRNEMISGRVYLTFPITKETSDFLTDFAHRCKMTQPELIEEICEDFKNNILELANKNLNENDTAPELRSGMEILG